MKTITLQGVPYSVNLETKDVYLYNLKTTTDSQEACIGKYNSETDTVLLNEDWNSQESTQEFLMTYRKNLKEHTDKSMVIARKLQAE